MLDNPLFDNPCNSINVCYVLTSDVIRGIPDFEVDVQRAQDISLGIIGLLIITAIIARTTLRQ